MFRPMCNFLSGESLLSSVHFSTVPKDHYGTLPEIEAFE